MAPHPSRDAAGTPDFPERVRVGTPFPAQRIRTDRGGESFAHEVRHRPRDRRIESRPDGPRAPHPNGEVERVRRTALEELRSTAGLEAPELPGRLGDWRRFHDRHRPHAALGGGTPAGRIGGPAEVIPSPEAVRAAYDPAEEIVRARNSRRRRGPPTGTRVT